MWRATIAANATPTIFVVMLCSYVLRFTVWGPCAGARK